MSNEKVFQMDFGKIYDALLNKATRKGRTKSEVDEIICWLTGYHVKEIEEAVSIGSSPPIPCLLWRLLPQCTSAQSQSDADKRCCLRHTG